MRKLIIIFSVVFFYNNTNAQTIISTSFLTDSVLTVDNSPYLVTNTPTIYAGVTVQFEKGCTIMFEEGNAFNVLGTLKLIGDENDSITLITNTGATYWGPITTDNGILILDYTILQNPKKIISASHGIIKINNSRISAVIGAIGEDGIAIHYADSVTITHSLLESDENGGKIDAIDADGISYGNISNNIIRHWPDDGIDIGTSSNNVTINNNIIYDTDCGISIGESSIAYAERNIIRDCVTGLQSHNNAILTTDHNTIYRVRRSVMPHHGTEANSGGTLYVTNTIMAKCIVLDYSLQSNSNLTMSYCISEKDTLPGNNNLFGDAIFTDTLNFDFHLASNSPCIDAGDPAYSGVFSGLYTDMGAFEYDSVSSSVNNISETNNLIVFPNPTKNILNIYSDKLNEKINIYNITGEKMKQIKLTKNNININVSNFSDGIYFIKLGTETVKFIKE